MAEETFKSETEVEAGGPMPYICGNCGKVIAMCEGGASGVTHVYCQSPGGHCRCPHCNKEHYLISHTHY